MFTSHSQIQLVLLLAVTVLVVVATTLYHPSFDGPSGLIAFAWILLALCVSAVLRTFMFAIF